VNSVPGTVGSRPVTAWTTSSGLSVGPSRDSPINSRNREKHNITSISHLRIVVCTCTCTRKDESIFIFVGSLHFGLPCTLFWLFQLQHSTTQRQHVQTSITVCIQCAGTFYTRKVSSVAFFDRWPIGEPTTHQSISAKGSLISGLRGAFPRPFSAFGTKRVQNAI
jgi:hypothetical protein